MGKLREEINGLKKNYWVYWKCSQGKSFKSWTECLQATEKIFKSLGNQASWCNKTSTP